MSPEFPHFDFYITGMFHVIERKPDPDWRLDRLTLPYAYVVAYCVDGEATYSFEGKVVRVVKGDLLFFPKGLKRGGFSNPDNPWSFFTVGFDAGFPSGLTREIFDGMERVIRSPHHYKLLPLFAELNRVWSGKRVGYLIKSRSLLMDILYYLVQERERSAYGAAHYNAIERTANLILSKYKDHFTIEELSRLAGLSPSHFRLMFKKITGMTSIQYQHQVRINKAKDLLLSGECNVTEAALAVGFKDIYYFSRLFKKLTGASPSDYLV